MTQVVLPTPSDRYDRLNEAQTRSLIAQALQSLGSNITNSTAGVLSFGAHLVSTPSTFNGSANVVLSTDATSANSNNTIVSRDASGNFGANVITAALVGNVTGHASLDLALTGGTMSGALHMGAQVIDGALSISASSTISGSDFVMNSNAHHVTGTKASPGGTANILTLTSSNVTRLIAGVDASGFDWTNQAENTEWMALVQSKLTIWTNGSATSGGGIKITTDSGSNPAIINADPFNNQFGQGSLKLAPCTVTGGHGAGALMALSYWSGTSQFDAFKVANVASGFGVTTLMVNGGSVVVGTDPTGTQLLRIGGALKASGAVQFSNFTAGIASFDASGNISSASGVLPVSISGNAATATALQTARNINGVSFDGTADITVTAAAGTLTGTTLNATVVTSSLTTIGTLVAGAVPASLVTAGTFGAGAYSFPSTLTVAGLLTANAGSIDNPAANTRFDTTGAQDVVATVAGTSFGPRYLFRNWQGTIGAPTATLSSDLLGQIIAVGYTGSAIYETAAIHFLAAQGWGATAGGSEIDFLVTPNGSLTAGIAVAIRQDSSVMFANSVSLGAGNVTVAAGGIVTRSVAAPTLNLFTTQNDQSVIQTKTASISAGPRYVFQSARGTIASPTVSQSADLLGDLQFAGYTGAAYAVSADILAQTTQLWATGTPNSQGAKLVFRTTPNGTATLTTALTLGQDQSAVFTGLVTAAANACIGPNAVVGPSGSTILTQANLRLASSVTATGANAYGLIVSTTLNAAANNDQLWGIRFTPTYVVGSFTGVQAIGMQTPTINTSTWTNPGDPIGFSISSVTGSGISANAVNAVLLDFGTASGATNNFVIRHTNFNVSQAGNIGIGANASVVSVVNIAGTGTSSATNGWGVLLSSTVVASANNVGLTGFQSAPTFSAGAFTGVKTQALSTGSISTAAFTSPGDTQSILLGNVDGTGAAHAYGIKFSNVSGATSNYLLAATAVSTFNVLASGAITSASTLSLGAKITNYNAIATAGWGVLAVQASARKTAQAAASGTVVTYTPAADGTFLVMANVLVTTATTFSFSVTCSYTDEGGTARVLTLTFSNVGGTLSSTLTNAGGAVPYEGLPQYIRAKASTAITIQTTSGGTYTAVAYNIDASIVQVA